MFISYPPPKKHPAFPVAPCAITLLNFFAATSRNYLTSLTAEGSNKKWEPSAEKMPDHQRRTFVQKQKGGGHATKWDKMKIGFHAIMPCTRMEGIFLWKPKPRRDTLPRQSSIERPREHSSVEAYFHNSILVSIFCCCSSMVHWLNNTVQHL